MKTIENILNISDDTMARIISQLPCRPSDACFFDIETTGLSPKVSSVYLIGAVSIIEDKARLTQFFADDYKSEEALLTAFSDYLRDCTHVVHFNGTTFDIPYLEKKYAEYHLASPFIKIESIDIYKRIRSFRPKKKDKNAPPSYFPTENLKLVTMEKHLGFDRGEDVSGKDCIEVYARYMQYKYAHNDTEAGKLLTDMLSHNHDDLMGTALCTQLLMYTDHIAGDCSCKITDECAIFTDMLPDGLTYPFELSYSVALVEGHVLIAYKLNKLEINIPIIHDTLYHYFPDYKNYFYLPDEDMAIHKSVGTYVDKDHREQATAKNCYIKKTGAFLPLPAKAAPDGQPIFTDPATGATFIAIETDTDIDTNSLIHQCLIS